MQCHTMQSCVRIAVGVLLSASVAAAAAAQGPPASTTLTFDRAVRVPGATLPAGTYVFERVASDREQRVVRIYRTAPRRLVTTLMTTPTTRDGGGPDVTFGDVPSGSTPAVRVWYERGSQSGHVFRYGTELQPVSAEPGIERSTR